MPKRIEKEARLERLRERFLADLAKDGLSYDHERMAYCELGRVGEATEMWTVFTSFPGERWYSEEIDVLVLPREGKRRAMELAGKVIKNGFDPALRPAKAVHRPRGIMFW